VISFCSDDIVLVLLQKPKLLPRLPAKPSVTPVQSPNFQTRQGQRRRRGSQTRTQAGGLAGKLTAGHAPCERAAGSRSAATTYFTAARANSPRWNKRIGERVDSPLRPSQFGMVGGCVETKGSADQPAELGFEVCVARCGVCSFGPTKPIRGPLVSSSSDVLSFSIARHFTH
jgi:hypothetical protein